MLLYDYKTTGVTNTAYSGFSGYIVSQTGTCVSTLTESGYSQIHTWARGGGGVNHPWRFFGPLDLFCPNINRPPPAPSIFSRERSEQKLAK
jgi:hypothetical protein